MCGPCGALIGLCGIEIMVGAGNAPAPATALIGLCGIEMSPKIAITTNAAGINRTVWN